MRHSHNRLTLSAPRWMTLSSPAAERGDFPSTRHCEEERRGNPRYTERLCK